MQWPRGVRGEARSRKKPSMDLLLLGVSHHTAPVDLRERVDFSRRGVVEALRELAIRPALPEAVVVTAIEPRSTSRAKTPARREPTSACS